jgi:hypothetical protein
MVLATTSGYLLTSEREAHGVTVDGGAIVAR